VGGGIPPPKRGGVEDGPISLKGEVAWRFVKSCERSKRGRTLRGRPAFFVPKKNGFQPRERAGWDFATHNVPKERVGVGDEHHQLERGGIVFSPEKNFGPACWEGIEPHTQGEK